MIDILIRLFVTWVIPGGFAVLVGAKKNRRDFAIVMGLVFGALGFFFGLGLGWFGLFIVCCFKKRNSQVK